MGEGAHYNTSIPAPRNTKETSPPLVLIQFSKKKNLSRLKRRS